LGSLINEIPVIKCKSVFIPGVARHLLKMGNPIYDIKPKKENPDASIFLFQETEKFKQDFITVVTSNQSD
jgi:hypothetical protein